MHESFILGFISSLIPHSPWRLRGKPTVLGLGRMVSFLIRDIPGDAGSVMRQIMLLRGCLRAGDGFIMDASVLRHQIWESKVGDPI